MGNELPFSYESQSLPTSPSFWGVLSPAAHLFSLIPGIQHHHTFVHYIQCLVKVLQHFTCLQLPKREKTELQTKPKGGKTPNNYLYRLHGLYKFKEDRLLYVSKEFNGAEERLEFIRVLVGFLNWQWRAIEKMGSIWGEKGGGVS